jgi:ArsR family transcriptional regulator
VGGTSRRRFLVVTSLPYCNATTCREIWTGSILEFFGTVIYLVICEENTVRKGTLAVVGHAGPVPTGDRMSSPHALAALAALGQPTRLEIFRLLIRAEPDGLPAGSIADRIGCPHNTLSAHLSILARSGLVHGTRDGRSIIYRADVEGMRTLIAFLVKDCCDGHPELCHLQDAIEEAKCTPIQKKSGNRSK